MNAAIDWADIAHEHRADARQAVSIASELLGVAPLLSGTFNDDTYERAVALYESLLAAVPEHGDIASLAPDAQALVWFEEQLGRALADYAETRWPEEEPIGGTPAVLLRTLMDQNDLTQSDLPEVGSQGVVSEILNGKRQINIRQIRALSQRFGIPQRFFLDE